MLKEEGTYYMWGSKGNRCHEIMNVQKTDSGYKPVSNTKFKTTQLTNSSNQNVATFRRLLIMVYERCTGL